MLKDAGSLPPVTQNDAASILSSLAETNWDDLRVFAAVAREGSLRKAGRRLGLKAPSVRRRIDTLEQQLKVRLFDRGPHGFTLTNEGRQIAGDTQSVEMILGDAFRRVQKSEADVRGECKLLISEGLATSWLIPFFFDAFIESYPHLLLRLGAASEVERSLVPPFDVQIRYAPPVELDLIHVRLGTFHFTYFASEKYIARYGRPKSQDDLARHRFADVTPTLTAESGIVATYSNAEALAHAALRTNSGLIAASAVGQGSVIGFLPSYAYLTRKDLVAVLPDLHYKTGIFAVFTENSIRRSSVRAVVDYLKSDVFDRHRMPWFGEEYEVPSEAWRDQFSAILAQQIAGQTKRLPTANE